MLRSFDVKISFFSVSNLYNLGKKFQKKVDTGLLLSLSGL